MALTKTVVIDKIEVIGPYRAVQVRTATVVAEDGSELTRSFHRHVLHPDDDITGEDAEVQAVCGAVWTDAVKASWTEHQAAQAAIASGEDLP